MEADMATENRGSCEYVRILPPAVSDNDYVDMFVGPVVGHCRHVSLVLGAEIPAKALGNTAATVGSGIEEWGGGGRVAHMPLERRNSVWLLMQASPTVGV